jgi:hypothetical protein
LKIEKNEVQTNILKTMLLNSYHRRQQSFAVAEVDFNKAMMGEVLMVTGGDLGGYMW